MTSVVLMKKFNKLLCEFPQCAGLESKPHMPWNKPSTAVQTTSL